MRSPSFTTIKNFYVQSQHGLRIDENNLLPFGTELKENFWEPIRIKWLYDSRQIGSEEQVKRYAQEMFLKFEPRVTERDDALHQKPKKPFKSPGNI